MQAQYTENKKEKSKKVGNSHQPYGKPYDRIRNIPLRRGGAVVDANGDTNYNTPIARTDFEVAVLKSLRKLPAEKQALLATFAEALYEPPLPEKAPEYYADRQVEPRLGRKENPVEFLVRVYPIVTQENISGHRFRNLDPRLYKGLHNWMSKSELPSHVKLVSISEAYDDSVGTVLASFDDPLSLAKKVYSLASIMLQRVSP